jgi:diphthine-ammonia ligase
MGLPLFTRDIKGKAVERGPEYGSRTSSGEGSEVRGDETEDLYLLVKGIKVSPLLLRTFGKSREKGLTK